MNEIPVPRASRHEQVALLRRIGRLTAASDRVHELTSKQLNLMRQHKQALVTTTVSGQVDVSGTAS